MDVPRYPRLNPAFMRFYAPFAPLFGWIDTRHWSVQYMQGLLMKRTVRRNAVNLAARSGTASPRVPASAA
jgi:hypothetical protein